MLTTTAIQFMKIQPLLDFFPSFIPFLLYAELHYRFRLFPFSRYYRKEPEIIADAPYRLEPGVKLPLLLLVKDAHWFPIFLESVEINLIDRQGKQKNISYQKNITIKDRWWYEIIHLDTNELTGTCSIKVNFNYTVRNQRKSCMNDNSLLSESKPLQTYLSSLPLPGIDHGWFWGDLHYHSWLTEDFAEFGAPLDATREIAKASGLSFVGLTDHSYDLDDKPGSWSETDPEKNKWKQLWSDTTELNKDGIPILIPGEEVSAFNSKNKTVHTLVLNHPEFIPGSGDGAERWFRTQSEFSIREVIKQLHPNSIAIAAHPRITWRRLQRFLLNRGQWETLDMEQEGISGFQILNGNFDDAFHEGLKQWIRLLLTGKKKFIYGGNDAHGNFNRYLQIKLPMLSLHDHRSPIMGKCKTGICLSEEASIETIIRALKQGKCVVSNGPVVRIEVRNQSSCFTLGESVNCDNIRVVIDSISSPEFGRIKELVLLFGDMEQKEERSLLCYQFEKKKYRDRYLTEFNLSNRRGYIRAQLTSSLSFDREFICYTNPIWINN